jgi:hypothetical protein
MLQNQLTIAIWKKFQCSQTDANTKIPKPSHYTGSYISLPYPWIQLSAMSSSRLQVSSSIKIWIWIYLHSINPKQVNTFGYRTSQRNTCWYK